MFAFLVIFPDSPKKDPKKKINKLRKPLVLTDHCSLLIPQS